MNLNLHYEAYYLTHYFKLEKNKLSPMFNFYTPENVRKLGFLMF